MNPRILRECEFVSEKYYKNTVFRCIVCIPAGHETDGACALHVCHDWLNMAEVEALEKLILTDEVPSCICVGICPGYLPAAIESGKGRGMRMQNYDLATPTYPDFVVNELMPYLTEKFSLNLDPSPDMHLVSGGSSGGISAWNMAWHRTDFFRRVYMSSPSFLSMGKGRDYPSLIRKVETKPIRAVTEYSENEPDDYFGASYPIGIDTEMALRFAGYDFMHSYYPGEGHCSRNGNVQSAEERLKFLWNNWRTEPVTVRKLSPRMEKLISIDAPWEEVTLPMPEKVRAISTGDYTSAGEYVPDGSRILFFTPDGGCRVAAEGFGDVSSLAFSSDHWRLYVGDRLRGCVYALTVQPDGSLEGQYLHATLEQMPDFRVPGAIDICSSTDDRVYAATELGIQCIRSFGLIDCIVPLPENLIPEEVEFGDDGCLYAKSGERVFRRKWLSGGRIAYADSTAPAFTEYYN